MNPHSQGSDPESKIELIRASLSGVLGARLVSYETAELLLDGKWEPWRDLPIRLHTDVPSIVSIAWSRFDHLWIATDASLPFDTGDSHVRWVINAEEDLNPVIGRAIRQVLLGRGQMAIEGEEIEIWTRLLIELDSGWFEIFNALDENGFNLHDDRPQGDFIVCLRQ